MSPEDLWQAAWQLLTRANNDRKHAYRTATLSTVTQAGRPNARTLVMRKADAVAFTLRLYTDIRSEKVADWSTDQTVHWLFWDPKKQIQFSASGKIERWEKSREAALFHQLPKYGRKAYATLDAPGKPASQQADGLPADWNECDLAATDYALDNFAVFETRLDKADLLHLDRDDGNQRISARRNGDNWTMNWITP